MDGKASELILQIDRVQAVSFVFCRCHIQCKAVLLKLCHGGIIDKTRYIVPEGGTLSGRFFEVDEFYGDNEGLVMAEIELENASDAFEKPSWLGQEVTGDRHYYNSYLSMHPFKTW